jgi:hypothetical protein
MVVVPIVLRGINFKYDFPSSKNFQYINIFGFAPDAPLTSGGNIPAIAFHYTFTQNIGTNTEIKTSTDLSNLCSSPWATFDTTSSTVTSNNIIKGTTCDATGTLCTAYTPFIRIKSNPTPNSAKYIFIDFAASWNEANQYCMAYYGTQLATVTSSADNTELVGVVPNYPNSRWIGLNDIKTEGHYEWASGSTVLYTNWNIGEPNNAFIANSVSGEDCVELAGLSSNWNDNDCANQFTFLCDYLKLTSQPSTLSPGITRSPSYPYTGSPTIMDVAQYQQQLLSASIINQKATIVVGVLTGAIAIYCIILVVYLNMPYNLGLTLFICLFDVMTDIVYISSQPFYSGGYFSGTIIILFAPWLLYMLGTRELLINIMMVQVPDRVMKSISLWLDIYQNTSYEVDHYDEVWKVVSRGVFIVGKTFLVVVLAALAPVLALISIIGSLLVYFLFVLAIVSLKFGVFPQITRKAWRMAGFSENEFKEQDEGIFVLNLSIASQVLLESCPQFGLILANGIWVNDNGIIGGSTLIFSFAIVGSLLSIINNMWPVVYWSKQNQNFWTGLDVNRFGLGQGNDKSLYFVNCWKNQGNYRVNNNITNSATANHRTTRNTTTTARTSANMTTRTSATTRTPTSGMTRFMSSSSTIPSAPPPPPPVATVVETTAYNGALLDDVPQAEIVDPLSIGEISTTTSSATITAPPPNTAAATMGDDTVLAVILANYYADNGIPIEDFDML